MAQDLKVIGNSIYSLMEGAWGSMSKNEESKSQDSPINEQIVESSREIAQHLASQENSSAINESQESVCTIHNPGILDLNSTEHRSHTTDIDQKKKHDADEINPPDGPESLDEEIKHLELEEPREKIKEEEEDLNSKEHRSHTTDIDQTKKHDADEINPDGPESLDKEIKHLELEEPREKIKEEEKDLLNESNQVLLEKQKIHVNALKRDTSQISTISTSSSPYKKDFSDSAAFSPLLSGAVRSVNPIIQKLLKSIQLLEANDESLKNLDLKDVKVFTNLHGEKLAKALEQNTNLEILDLSNTNLQTNTAIQISKALEVNKGLKVLILSNNDIRPDGMREIAQMLKVNTTLRELVLSNQKYSTGSSAEEAFAEALKKNTTLLKLALMIKGAPARTAIDRGLMKNNRF